MLEQQDADVLISAVRLPLHDGLWLISELRNRRDLAARSIPLR